MKPNPTTTTPPAFRFEHSRDRYPAAGTLTFPDLPGYAARIEYDVCPSNPLEDSDYEPPLASYRDSWEGPDLPALWADVPDAIKTERWKDFLRELDEWTPGARADWKAARRNFPDTSPVDTLTDMIGEAEKPHNNGWRIAEEYCDLLAAFCAVAGIVCRHEVSRGYSQGDAAHLFCYVPRRWVELTGAPDDPDNLAAVCRDTCDLWTAWAWGDVYGVAEIVRPDGTEASEDACWGFYGTDLEASGLVKHARGAIEADMQTAAEEEAEAFVMACRDMATVPA